VPRLARDAQRAGAAHTHRTGGNLLEGTSRKVFDFDPPDQMNGTTLTTVGSAALGALLDDPHADLEAMRPGLAACWRTQMHSFGEAVADANSPGSVGQDEPR
jgi:hypothetical protein